MDFATQQFVDGLNSKNKNGKLSVLLVLKLES